MTIHEAIRDARRLSGNMSQEKLGDAVGLPQSGISKYESGEREPGSGLIERIMDATGTRISYWGKLGWQVENPGPYKVKKALL